MEFDQPTNEALALHREASPDHRPRDSTDHMTHKASTYSPEANLEENDLTESNSPRRNKIQQSSKKPSPVSLKRAPAYPPMFPSQCSPEKRSQLSQKIPNFQNAIYSGSLTEAESPSLNPKQPLYQTSYKSPTRKSVTIGELPGHLMPSEAMNSKAKNLVATASLPVRHNSFLGQYSEGAGATSPKKLVSYQTSDSRASKPQANYSRPEPKISAQALNLRKKEDTSVKSPHTANYRLESDKQVEEVHVTRVSGNQSMPNPYFANPPVIAQPDNPYGNLSEKYDVVKFGPNDKMKNRKKKSEGVLKKYQAYNKDMKALVSGELIFDLDSLKDDPFVGGGGNYLANKPHRQTEKRTILSNSVFSKKPKEAIKPRPFTMPQSSSSASKQSSGYGNKISNWMQNVYRSTKTKLISKRSVNLKTDGFFRVNKTAVSEYAIVLNHRFENLSVVANPDISHAYQNESENESRTFKLNQGLARAFQSITWFTYRDHLEQNIGRSNLSGDTGWGCMVRTGQMIICQAIKRHLLGERFKLEDLNDAGMRHKYLDILRLFMDNHNSSQSGSDISPFGIHSICHEGQKNLSLTPGEWYGPHMISIVLRNLNRQYLPIPKFGIHVCLDSNIIFEEVDAMIDSQSVFVLVPLRLGIDDIQPQYLVQVRLLFTILQNVGIAGGKSHMALYLVGDEDMKDPSSGIFFLDPHQTQSSIPGESVNPRPPRQMNLMPYLKSYHCTDLRSLEPREMCTSMAPGFYLRDRTEFERWKMSLYRMHSEFGDQCIFSLYEKKPSFMKDYDLCDEEERKDSFEDFEDFEDLAGSFPLRAKEFVPQSMGPEQVDSGMVKPKSGKGRKTINNSNFDVKNLKQHPTTKVSHTSQPVIGMESKGGDFLDDFEVIEKNEYSMDEEEYQDSFRGHRPHAKTVRVHKDPYM